MAKQVKVLYDFDGEVENGELIIRENQILTIIRQDVGDGWWEAETANRQRGLIPEAYVEEINDPWNAPEDAPPPPPPPPADSGMDLPMSGDLPAPPTFESQPVHSGSDSWDRPGGAPPPPPDDDPYSASIDPWDKLEQEQYQQPQQQQQQHQQHQQQQQQASRIVSPSGMQRQDSVGREDDWDDDDDEWDDNQSTPDYPEGDPNVYYDEQGVPQQQQQWQHRKPPKDLRKPWQSSTVPRNGPKPQNKADSPDATDPTYCNARQVAGIGKSRSFHQTHGKLSTFQNRQGLSSGSLRIPLPNRPLEMPPAPSGGRAKEAPVEGGRAGYRGREMVRGDSTSTFDSDDDEGSANYDPTVNGSGNYGLSPPNRQYKRNSDATAKTTGTVKKNFASRFSVFAKSGGEAYLLGTGAKKGVSPNVEIRIVESNDGPNWEDPGRRVGIEIKNPKKETKMKGIKSFIAYQITPSDTGIQVSRRYKHFDWLYERLAEKFTFVCIPPLPDKQVTGRYEEAFIEKRMEQLQRWLNRMGSHPVISQADVFRHFLSCTDEKKWKQGKRKAEKDEHVGAAFLQVIQAPEKPLEINVVEKQHDNFSRFQKSMDQSVSAAVQTCHDFSKKHLGPFKREFQKVGQGFTLLAQSFDLDTRPRSSDDDRPPQVSTKLTEAMKYTGQTYDTIGQLFSDQPRYDGHILEDFLREYSGLLSTFPDMIHFHKHTISTVKECQKQREEQKLDYEEADTVKKRADVVSYAMMAEINHFHAARVQDFKQVMQSYLTEQIRFYQNITSKLQEALQKYQEI